ncbi:MAG TPA: hypothetical protein VHV31_16045, partial [Nitrolancea sp.]|nr:hypothetical protein [Nitrolancea sp.]
PENGAISTIVTYVTSVTQAEFMQYSSSAEKILASNHSDRFAPGSPHFSLTENDLGRNHQSMRISYCIPQKSPTSQARGSQHLPIFDCPAA